MNLDDFRREARRYREEVNQAVTIAVEEAAGYAEAEAKRLAAATRATANGKTYYLVKDNHHRQNIKGETLNGGFTARLIANADYAPYLEFGTGGLVDIPEGFEALAAQFKGKGVKKINLPARPHIIPAAYKARDFLERQIEKKIENL